MKLNDFTLQQKPTQTEYQRSVYTSEMKNKTKEEIKSKIDQLEK